MIPDFTSFGGVLVNDGAGPYLMVVPGDAGAEYSATPSFVARPNDAPIYSGWRAEERRLRFVVVPGPGAAGMDTKAWANDAQALFSVYGGVRTLRGTWEGETVEADVVVTRFGPQSLGVLGGELAMLDPLWRSTDEDDFTTSPITPGGNVPAAPTITVEPTGADHKLFVVTLQNLLTRDLGMFPIVVGGGTVGGVNHGTLNTTGVGATDPKHYAVFAPDGQSVPFFVLSPNHATGTRFFFRVSIPALSSVTVLILCGAEVENPLLSAEYDTAGWDVANAGIGNHTWIWLATPTFIGSKPVGAMFQLSKSPRVTGSWFLTRMGTPLANTSFRYRQTSTQASFDFIGDQTYAGDADGIAIVTQVPLGSTNALQGLTATPSGTVPPLLRMKYLLPGEISWLDVTGTPASGDADGATQLAVYGEAGAATVAGTLVVGGAPSLDFDTTKIPVVTVVGTETVRRLDGAITNALTNDAVVFEDVWVDSTHAVVIRFLDPRSIEVTAGGRMIGAPRPVSTAGCFRLMPGVPNAWSHDLDGDVTISVRRRYAV